MSPTSELEKLCLSNSSATFLKTWIEIHFPKSSLESISRKCNISSKSTIHDILSGRRKASLDLIGSICIGLKIKGPEKKLLLKIWECEKKGITLELTQEIEPLRSKVREKKSKIKSSEFPLLDGWDYVYASLGSLEEGATLDEIVNKSRIPQHKVLAILENLIKLQLITHNSDSNRYIVEGLHSVFEEFSIDEKEYLKEKINIAQRRLVNDFGKKDETLFRHYFFSIRKKSFPELRQKLKELLDEYADESEVSTGEELAEMFVAFNLKN